MQKHTKVYLDYFGYGEQDFIPCENCGNRAVDVHHLDGRGPGMDVIENLMGLCRDDHDRAGAEKEFNEYLKDIHLQYIERL
jgi:hypothetical protein